MCYGTGFSESVEPLSEELKREVLDRIHRQNIVAAHAAAEVAKERVIAEKEKSIAIKKAAETHKFQRLLNPSPTLGGWRYLEAKKYFFDRLYTCVICGYDVNYDPEQSCGQCWGSPSNLTKNG